MKVEKGGKNAILGQKLLITQLAIYRLENDRSQITSENILVNIILLCLKNELVYVSKSAALFPGELLLLFF